MTKKTINPLFGALSAAVLLMPLFVVSGCNEPTTQAAATATTDKVAGTTDQAAATPGTADDFQSIGAFDQRRLRFSDDPIQIGLPVEIAAFKAGVNSDLAQTACADCHSADYPTTQPVMPRAKWKATIAKMHDKFSAPWEEIFGTTLADGTLVPADAATIAANLQKIEDYLVANYGKEI